jgi:adenosylcobinamide kinase/adenosylcobinamide-phosphate guanylyltransferase
LTLARDYGRRAFLATGVATDEEMQRRIRRHQAERGPGWDLLEEPQDAAAVIRGEGANYDLILLDCLTFWVSNVLLSQGADHLQSRLSDLIQAMNERKCSIVVVSNEVGLGVVPDNDLGRQFRDQAGLANQMVAAIADRVIMMIAGIPMEVKKI